MSENSIKNLLLIVGIIFLGLAFLDVWHGALGVFYRFLRVYICSTSVFLAYLYFRANKRYFPIIYIILAIIFNPFDYAFDVKSAWLFIDVLTITFFTFSIIKADLPLIRHHLIDKIEGNKNRIKNASAKFKELIDRDGYFNNSLYEEWNESCKPLSFLFKANLTSRQINSIPIPGLKKLINYHSNGRKIIDKRNDNFITTELVTYKPLFDRIESYPLNKKQREAIVRDEDANLLVAGPGTGKTSTLVGKVAYIIEKGLAEPGEILVVAFTKSVAKELKDRINVRVNADGIKITTFNSIGYEILGAVEGKNPSVSRLAKDDKAFHKTLQLFLDKFKEDNHAATNLLNYFIEYLVPCENPLIFSNAEEYNYYLKSFETRTLQGEKVKSYEECIVANYLYSQQISYEYEKKYPHEYANGSSDKIYKHYEPDFYLSDYDIYIEHFGIDRKGKSPFDQNGEYLKGIEWKRNIHQQFGTKLIETFSYERQEGTLISNLREKLLNAGCEFEPLSKNIMFNRLEELGSIENFVKLLGEFLNLRKSNNFPDSQITSKAEKSFDSKRALAFLEIFQEIHKSYQQYLIEKKEVDFNDQILKATDYINRGRYVPIYKYVLVDEFQDVTVAKANFIISILKKTLSCKLFCVGDDWQSIFRFQGSDLSIMTQFKKWFGFYYRIFLDQTHRYDSNLLNLSSKFILKNPKQITKNLTTNNENINKSIFLFKSSSDDETDLNRVLKEISLASNGQGATVLIIGRYNHDKPEDMTVFEEYTNLKIKFTTAHLSKGTESDFVIVIGLSSRKFGFPSAISDDPLKYLALSERDDFPYAEERRVFFVAITRAKKGLYLIEDKNNPSIFTQELRKGEYKKLVSIH
jgi:DNA helicase-4